MRSDLYTAKLREALRFIEREHRGQLRKGTEDVPYVLHPIAVAMTLARAGVDDEDLLLAALLHDVAEDTAVDLGEIERRFGNRVATTVVQLTKPPCTKPSPTEVAAMLHSEEAVIVKSADLIVNLGDLVHDTAEHGPGHVRALFENPAAKLGGYLELAQLLSERLASQPRLRAGLTETSRAADVVLRAIESD